MKLKVLATVSLGAFLLLGCRGGGGANATNTAVLNTNTNTAGSMSTPMPTPVAQTGESGATDTVLKTKVETALKAKGFNNVIVDTGNPATLRGTYPKGQLDQVMQTAMQAAGKPFKNEMAEAK